MKSSFISITSIIAISLIAATGCVESSSGVVFSRDEAIRAQDIYFGTVTEVREGKIEGEQSGIGAIGGTAAGGVVGNLFGGGKGNDVATVAGAIAGAVAGNAIEKSVTSSQALQITVQLDSGRTIVVVQEKDVMFTAGQRVRVVVGSNGKSRVQAL